MERKPPSSPGEILAVVSRRKYWIIFPFVIVLVLGIVLGHFVPRTYQSVTTIMVVPKNVPSSYVSTETAVELTKRVQDIGLEVISGDAFVGILDKLNLYPELREKGKTSQVVSKMRRNTTVAPVPDTGDGRGGIGAFTVSFVGNSPQQAQTVTSALADFFVHENQAKGNQNTKGTDAFLRTQVAAAAQQLAAQQAKIQAFKNAHMGSLPEQAQANLAMINQYQTQLQANESALDQDNQQRVYLQSVLNVSPATGDSNASAPVAATPLQIELASKQAELHADLLKYTPEYPDVIRLKGEIAALKVQIHQAPKSAAAPVVTTMPQTTGPSVNDQLRSQLVALNTEIKSREARNHQLEAEMTRLQGSIGMVPAVQTEFAGLDSTYQEMQKNYNLLVENQQHAAMTVALGQHDEDGQLIVVQPATLPTAPYRPDLVLLDMGAALVGLLVGFICALIVELRDDTMHTSNEVAEYLKLPVIVDLPKCPPFSDEGWKISPTPAKS